MRFFPGWLSLAGLLAFAGGAWLVGNRHAQLDAIDWQPLNLDLAQFLQPGSETRADMQITEDTAGFYEIELMFQRLGDDDLLDREVVDFTKPPAFEFNWRVDALQGEPVTVAAGDASDYLYLVRRHDWRQKLKLGLSRSPYGLNKAGHDSFGLGGVLTASRGLGRFELPAGRYQIRVDTPTGMEDFAVYRPVVQVRPQRRLFQEKFAEHLRLIWTGWVLMALGFCCLALAAFSGVAGRSR